MDPSAPLSEEEKAGAEEKLENLKRVLAEDVNLTPEQREAELKKARIALMRQMRVRRVSRGGAFFSPQCSQHASPCIPPPSAGPIGIPRRIAASALLPKQSISHSFFLFFPPPPEPTHLAHLFLLSQSPTTPYNSVEDFSKQAAQAKAKKANNQAELDAEALNSKLSALGDDK